MSPQDQKFLQRLIALEEAAYRFRYVALALGIVCLVIALGGYALLFSISKDKATHFGSHPLFYLLGVGGGLGIGYAVRGWRGNPANRLIISLAKARQPEDKGVQQALPIEAASPRD
jgi:hypothetical protein